MLKYRRRLRQLPLRVVANLALFALTGAIDLAYHIVGLAIGADWLIKMLGASPAVEFNVNLAESILHGIVALFLIAFILTALAFHIKEDEREDDGVRE